ncbi:MAG: tetratricopeptide repeat protein [Acidobacteria bacterium]|nr:MAG: tetratricopeptide repeat protein [Acidobacteriota bacterium]
MTESATDERQPVQLGRFIPYALAIFLVSLVVRLVHLWQIRTAPFFQLLMGDAQSYHAWAQQIAAGDWIGSDVFYQAPLYPYFLGLVYAVLGDGPMIVRLCQAVIGSLACVLLALAGWRLFSKQVGIIAGLMLAVYAPAIFFDSLIQKSVLAGFLLCLMLALLGGLIVEPTRRWPWLWVGLTIGCLMLTRENAMVFVGAILFWLLWSQRHLATERFVLAGCLLAGLALVLVPVATRNKAVSGEFHLTTSQFGPHFYIGNNENASGIYEPLRFGHADPKYERQDATELAEQATGTPLSPAEVSRYWTRRTLAYIWTQPGDWLQLMGRKVMLAWNASEVADTEDQLTYADWSLLLRGSGAVWHFGVLAPLALVGVLATWPRRGELTLLYLLLAAYTLALVAFAVMARYRYPLVPFLILFAAAGVANIPQLLRTRPRPHLAWGVAATAVLAVFCNWPIFSMAQMRAVTDSNVGTELQVQGRLDEAIALYRDALARNPNNAIAYSNLGTALAANGQMDEAIAQHRRALDLAPNDADGHYNLGNALAAQGAFADAVSHLREALRIEPGFAEAHVNLGNALVTLEQLEDAAEHYRQATELEPDWVEAWNNLGLVAVAQGKRDEGIALFRQALDTDPDFGDAHTNLGAALQQAGAVDDALTHFRRAVELMPESASAHNDLGMALGAQDALDDAIVQFRRATELDPTFIDGYNNLALLFRLRGAPADAIAQYREILKIAPNDPTAHNDLGIALAQQNQPDDAVDHFRQALQSAPDYADAHGNLATVLQLQGKLDDAIRHYREAARIASGNTELERRLQAALAERSSR